MRQDGVRSAEKRDPAHPVLPPSGDEYWELEALRQFGGDWWRWQALPPMVRGRLMAHVVEKSWREAYEMDHKPSAAKPGISGNNGWGDMQKRFGL